MPSFHVTFFSTILVTSALTACSPLPQQSAGFQSAPQANHVAQSASDAEHCRALLSNKPTAEAASLDAGDFRLLNWNIQKGQQPGWQSDLQNLAEDAQLVLIQEAALDPKMMNANRLAPFWSFAPGYKNQQAQTGVLTSSSVKPLTHCNLTAWEPWLKTPKATNITEYALHGSDETLVVVNIHALNFTLGVKDYTKQMNEVRAALRDHTGPLILSGDFNSWRHAREVRLQQLVDDLGLSALDFETDKRTQVFGRPIDHIYVRGLTALKSSSRAVSSSDHNPLWVNLRLL